MADLVSAAMARRRFQTSFLGSFAVVALLLASLGLYGLLAYLIRQRMTEIGIRLALGAGRRDIVRLVVGHGIGLTAAGLTIGLGAALLLARVVSVWLYDTTPTDRIAYGTAGLTLLAASLLACYLPARRALRADVVAVLRAE